MQPKYIGWVGCGCTWHLAGGLSLLCALCRTADPLTAWMRLLRSLASTAGVCLPGREATTARSTALHVQITSSSLFHAQAVDLQNTTPQHNG